ncbi:MAG TPA: EthD domain-containing protein [Phenylobacterium sp.]|uniref:EthD domain-containing protein n=1 Tax=Phenylobacterium sp. TaxID=1871053 RepID=UPI002B48167D|nr:EthD domain-containing protein [Phenylobacterium sp.]HKR88955.1 EthD domain-containing protein [Phenylobacterium sp.]
MIKTVYFMKRKPGLSRSEFRTYYEDVHRKMGEKVLGTLAARYVRHYLDPVRVPEGTPAYDVVTEIWFTNRELYERGMEELAQDDFIADLMRLFDMDGAAQYLFEDSESDLSDD